MRSLAGAMGLVVGCVDPGGSLPGQFGEEDDGVCTLISQTPLPMDQLAQVGARDTLQDQSPDDVVAMIEGSHAHTLTWDQSGAQTGVSVSIVYEGGAAEHLIYEHPQLHDPSVTIHGGDPCDDRVQIEASITVTTNDGLLDEAWTGWVSSAGSVAYAEVLLDPPGGSLVPTDHLADPTDFDPVVAGLSLTLSSGDTMGRVSAIYTGSDPSAEPERRIGGWQTDPGEEE